MNCDTFQERLRALIEDRPSRNGMSAEVSEHGRSCPSTACHQAWDEYELLAAIIPVLQSSLPDVSLCAGVMDRLRLEHGGQRASARVATLTSDFSQPLAAVPLRKGSTGRSSFGSRVAVAVAVACLLLIVPLIRLDRDHNTSVARNDVPASPSIAAAPPSDVIVSQTAPARSGVRSYAGVPQSATEFVTDAMVLFVPADFSDPEDEDPSRPEQWRGRLGESLEPIGRELGTAVDAFLEAVNKPPMRST